MANFLSRLFGTERPDLPQLPQLNDPDDFYDMCFAVTGIIPEGEDLTLTCRGLAGDKTVGFDVTLPEHLLSGLETDAEGMVGLSRNATLPRPVTLTAANGASLALARALPGLTLCRPRGLGSYQDAPELILPALTFTGIHLEEGDRSLRDSATRIKLFYEHGLPDDDPEDEDALVLYWEAFLIADLPNGLLRLDEKDPSYRQEMLDTLIAAWGS